MAIQVRTNNSNVTLKSSSDQGIVKTQLANPSITLITSDIGSGGTFQGLSDTPDNYISQGGSIVAVKVDESGLEYIPADFFVSNAITLSDLTDANNPYYGGLKNNGTDWVIYNYFPKARADATNNPAYTNLNDAWINRATLTYT